MTEEEINKKHHLEDMAESAGRQARKFLEQNAIISEGTDALATAICEKPVKSMLLALGVGLLIGKIFRRSK